MVIAQLWVTASRVTGLHLPLQSRNTSPPRRFLTSFFLRKKKKGKKKVKCTFHIWLAACGPSLSDAAVRVERHQKHLRRIRLTSTNHSRSPLEIVPGHFKCILRSYGCIFDCRIVFIHIIGFFVTFFMENKPFYCWKTKMFASMSVQKSCYFILFLFWMLYIMKFFRFGILRSPLQPVSYICKLLENSTKKHHKKKREQQKIRYETISFLSVPPGFL